MYVETAVLNLAAVHGVAFTLSGKNIRWEDGHPSPGRSRINEGLQCLLPPTIDHKGPLVCGFLLIWFATLHPSSLFLLQVRKMLLVYWVFIHVGVLSLQFIRMSLYFFFHLLLSRCVRHVITTCCVIGRSCNTVCCKWAISSHTLWVFKRRPCAAPFLTHVSESKWG